MAILVPPVHKQPLQPVCSFGKSYSFRWCNSKARTPAVSLAMQFVAAVRQIRLAGRPHLCVRFDLNQCEWGIHRRRSMNGVGCFWGLILTCCTPPMVFFADVTVLMTSPRSNLCAHSNGGHYSSQRYSAGRGDAFEL
jgi:hypothetical protein